MSMTDPIANNHQRQLLRKTLRSSLRSKRLNLSPLQQQLNATKLAHRLINLKQLKNAKKIAVYLSMDGEINLEYLIKLLWKANKLCYLPVLDKKLAGHLIFLPYTKNQKLVKNRFKILEPVYNYRNSIAAKQLDIILMPLVGFDKQVNRLGMGGGFYDRSLAFFHNALPAKNSLNEVSNRSIFKPMLIGVAHSIQEVNQIPIEPWDIRVEKIFTEKGCC
ncbi:MAG: 5-formyltetrahydrofolate cyclo-ligase [Pseudomonadota bacterium]